MNRHIIDYAPLCVDPLGAPIRKDQPKPEPKWEPAGPHHEKRVVDGRLEVRAKALPSPLPTAPVTPLVQKLHGFVIVGESSPVDEPVAAPTEWQDGAPPCPGWYEAQDDYDRARGCQLFRYWRGKEWSRYASAGHGHEEKLEMAGCPSYIGPPLAADSSRGGSGHNIRWRGPRLTGADWPEPQ